MMDDFLIPLIPVPPRSRPTSPPREAVAVDIKEMHPPKVLFDLTSGNLQEILLLLKLENYAQMTAGTEIEFALVRDADLGAETSKGVWMLTVAKNETVEDELAFQIQYRDGVIKDSIHIEFDCRSAQSIKSERGAERGAEFLSDHIYFKSSQNSDKLI